MAYNDDEDLDQPLSSTHQLERGDHRKQERREHREKLDRFQQRNNTGLVLSVLKGAINMFRPTQSDKPDRAPKTMTHKEEEEQRIHTVDTKPSPDQLLQQGEAEQKADKAMQYEEEDSSSG